MPDRVGATSLKCFSHPCHRALIVVVWYKPLYSVLLKMRKKKTFQKFKLSMDHQPSSLVCSKISKW